MVSGTCSKFLTSHSAWKEVGKGISGGGGTGRLVDGRVFVCETCYPLLEKWLT